MAKSVDPDQTLENAASNPGLHCLPRHIYPKYLKLKRYFGLLQSHSCRGFTHICILYADNKIAEVNCREANESRYDMAENC